MPVSKPLCRVLLALAALAAGCATSTQPVENQPSQQPEAAAVQEQTFEHPDANKPLGMDPAVRVGTLSNGLTYYIRKHLEPGDRVNLWLAVNAGSVLEDEDQKGLAHYVEHMAFNGTKRFEKNTLIDFIERLGMGFGSDVNAYTSFDETVYMLTVPTDNKEMLSTGLDVIEDWSSAVSFDASEVEKERGVIIEEWRLGRGAQQRVLDKQWPIFLEGSKYAQRKPIGEKEILEKASVATLKRFYSDWYRPNNMAVIIVGDIDPDAMERDVKERFGNLKNPAKQRPRTNVPVPLVDKTRVAVVTDAEASMTTVSVVIKGPKTELSTEGDYRSAMVEELLHDMLRARLQELTQKPESPFAFAFSYPAEMGRAVDTFNLFGGAKPGKVEETAGALTTELERVRRHGFLASEFERQKAATLRAYERAVAEQDKVESGNYAAEIVSHFLEDAAMPGAAEELALVKKYLPTITLEDVNARVATWTARKDRVLMASGASRDKMPSQKALLAVIDRVSDSDVSPYEDEATGATLMAKAPAAGTIVKKETIKEIGISVWTLSNGAKVVLKPTDFKNDEVLFRAFSPGGSSLVPDSKYWSGDYAASLVSEAGMGEYDSTQISKMMAGKTVRVSPYVSELEEGFRGMASPKDIETLLQMVYLSFTAPRKDPEAFEAWKGQMSAFVKNQDLSPQSSFFEKLEAFAHRDHLRRKPLTMEALGKMNLDDAYEVYKDRFGDAGDFTFLFVGNIEESQLETLAATYLASLPTTGRKETWKDVGAKRIKGVKRFELEKGQDPKSFVFMTFHGKAKYTPEAQDDIELLAEVLDIRLREVLREELSGVYGAFSSGDIDRRPRPEYTYMIGFGCGPDNVKKLKTAVFDIIGDIKKNGVKEDYLAKVREQRRRALETDMKKNRWWMSQLTKHYRFGTDAKSILEASKAVERVSNKNLQRAAKRYLNERQYIDGTLMPAADAPKPKAAG